MISQDGCNLGTSQRVSVTVQVPLWSISVSPKERSEGGFIVSVSQMWKPYSERLSHYIEVGAGLPRWPVRAAKPQPRSRRVKALGRALSALSGCCFPWPEEHQAAPIVGWSLSHGSAAALQDLFLCRGRDAPESSGRAGGSLPFFSPPLVLRTCLAHPCPPEYVWPKTNGVWD